tara:strand:- start:292 stop:1551 length:1260 start_codon:yes stop_codon:yes gene_type:complete
MGRKPKSSKEISGLQTVGRQRAAQILSDDALFDRFAASPLQTAMPQLQASPTFLGGAASPFAASLAYQALPGMTYANRPGATTPFYPQTNVAPATPPPPSGDSFKRSEPTIDRGRISDPADIQAENAILLAELVDQANEMNFERQDDMRDAFKDFELDQAIRRGPFQIEDYDDILGDDNLLVSRNAPRGILSLQDLQNIQDSIGDNVMMTMADGGIASLPMQMSGGGMPGGMDLYGGAPASEPTGMQKFGKMMSNLGGRLKDFSSELAGGSSSQVPADLENMSKEELIALIMKNRGGMRSNPSAGRDPSASSSSGPDIGQIAQLASMVGGMQSGGLAALAEGGDVDFPRMNGPISGPGTETSDDIPAMLSDGEFVVNAKAVRGVGKLNGAGKSKAEQRREGARMMYALQKAGEQAMRKA